MSNTEKRKNITAYIFLAALLLMAAIITVVLYKHAHGENLIDEPIDRIQVNIEDYNGKTITGSDVVWLLETELENYEIKMVVDNGISVTGYMNTDEEEYDMIKDKSSDRYIAPSKAYSVYILHTDDGKIMEIDFTAEE